MQARCQLLQIWTEKNSRKKFSGICEMPDFHDRENKFFNFPVSHYHGNPVLVFGCFKWQCPSIHRLVQIVRVWDNWCNSPINMYTSLDWFYPVSTSLKPVWIGCKPVSTGPEQVLTCSKANLCVSASMNEWSRAQPRMGLAEAQAAVRLPHHSSWYFLDRMPARHPVVTCSCFKKDFVPSIIKAGHL